MFIGRFCERFTAFPAKIKNARNRNKANILHHQNENSIPLALSNSELTKKRTILSSWLIDTTWRTFGALTSTFWRDNYSLLIMRRFYHIRTVPSTVFDQFLRNLHDFLPENRVFSCFLPCNGVFGGVLQTFFVFYRSQKRLLQRHATRFAKKFCRKTKFMLPFYAAKAVAKTFKQVFFRRTNKFQATFAKQKRITNMRIATIINIRARTCTYAHARVRTYRTHVYARMREKTFVRNLPATDSFSLYE